MLVKASTPETANSSTHPICRSGIERCVIEPTLASLEEFQERDSGWALTRILNLTVNVNKYNPLRAGCLLQVAAGIV